MTHHIDVVGDGRCDRYRVADVSFDQLESLKRAELSRGLALDLLAVKIAVERIDSDDVMS